ncbi:MAG: tetratricopeptide repeat protein [Opitutaceae bacterium]|nr:tetratricopeptide repeat protein [Opitutaceae bacterium]
MPRLLLTFSALLGLTVTSILGAPEVIPAASESAIEVRYTVADHVSRLNAEAEKLRRELARLESGESEFATDDDLLRLDTSAVRKELAHRESALAAPQESHAHACEFLQDAIDALRPLATLPPVVTSMRALAIDLERLGPDHPNMATYHANLAPCWFDLGDYRKALESYQAALRVRAHAEGPDDPQAARMRERIGACIRMLEQQELSSGTGS